MVKSSTEMITRAKQVLRNMLKRCLERNEHPSYLEMYYSGYCEGVVDSGKDIIIETNWHYIKKDGLPPNDDKCFCLIQGDGYLDTGIGYYDAKKNEWCCNFWCQTYDKVVAWHLLPKNPEDEEEDCNIFRRFRAVSKA